MTTDRTTALDVLRPCHPATTHRYRRVGQSDILCCSRCGQGKADIVGLRLCGSDLIEAARQLIDWYDGPPFVYEESDLETRLDAIRVALDGGRSDDH